MVPRIAPITGKVRRAIIFDISLGLGLGIAGGYAFWYGAHVPGIKRNEIYYAKLAAEAKAE
ncbi:hypothetical protein BJ085DRAFT_19362 [Dimargaris cristalligena]|uniref:Cytochrome c oxidase subunit 9, mitochondrial n=1 Tax=Dimargaris cristalligena TaxID=215637 RepID=A0A4Q0A1H4_9FUNG|nr:hypothetical protein BJ085DRAFT_19362 [Dimargaris cristalligena]|eukprot:RKP39142.1 hypothetical protein BJ085DRAFT_19362 [Dimargaris cristalligena]